jgi:hypothetical protein
MKQSILLYRYLPWDSAIKTIEGKSFRVSRIVELNDPFEWVPGLDPVKPEAADCAKWCMVDMNGFLKEMNDNVGILSFSESIHEPVLWSHYADSHRGIAFEVDIITPKLRKVKYTNERPVIDPRWINDQNEESRLLDILKKFWYRKSPGWAYEKERRVAIELNTCRTSNGMFFLDIPTDYLNLKRVILGARCNLGMSYVRRALDLNGFDNVGVVQAKQCNKTYDIRC